MDSKIAKNRINNFTKMSRNIHNLLYNYAQTKTFNQDELNLSVLNNLLFLNDTIVQLLVDTIKDNRHDK